MNLNETQLLQAYRKMRQIRDFEDRVHDEFATGIIPGFVHLYAGEEASAVGFCMHTSTMKTALPVPTGVMATASPRGWRSMG